MIGADAPPVNGCCAPLVSRRLRLLQLLVLKGWGLGRMPMAWEMGRAVVSSHGLRRGEKTNGLVNGPGGCWLVGAARLRSDSYDPCGVTRYWHLGSICCMYYDPCGVTRY